MPNGDDDGRCFDCGDGDWHCPEPGQPPCGAAGGLTPDHELVGTAWLSIDLFRKHGFRVYTKCVPQDPGVELPPHTVDVFLKKVYRESPKPLLGEALMTEVEMLKWLDEHGYLVSPDDDNA